MLCVAIATGVHAAISLASREIVVFAPYYSATLVAALFAGAEAGGFAAILGGAVASRLFVPPEWNVALLTWQSLSNWILYGLSSLVIIFVAESHLALLRRLHDEQEKCRLIAHEMAHRMKNLVANVQAIVALTLRDEKELRYAVCGRLDALAATNGLLMRSGWRSASLVSMLADELRPYGLARIRWNGPDVQCPPDVALVLTMVIHELATNAGKYGALSRPDGEIDIAWEQVAGRLQFDWIERSGAQIQAPVRNGFGTALLHSSLDQFQGHIDRRFGPNGMSCRFSLTIPPQPPQEGHVERAA